MNENFDEEDDQGEEFLEQEESQVIVLIKKIQQQLGFLEKKIDLLLGKSQDRPFRGKSFSKPFRKFGHSQHQERGDRDHHPRERDFGQGRPFDKQQSGENRGFAPKKKPFFHQRKNQG